MNIKQFAVVICLLVTPFLFCQTESKIKISHKIRYLLSKNTLQHSPFTCEQRSLIEKAYLEINGEKIDYKIQQLIKKEIGNDLSGLHSLIRQGWHSHIVIKNFYFIIYESDIFVFESYSKVDCQELNLFLDKMISNSRYISRNKIERIRKKIIRKIDNG